jgi:hypothetical protein
MVAAFYAEPLHLHERSFVHKKLHWRIRALMGCP